MLSIIGNLRMNSLTRLDHFKHSFQSFDGVSDNWLINIRGTFRDEAIKFLKEKLGDRLVLFNLQDDSRGWLTNSLEMLEKVKHPYVLVWNEDHSNCASIEDLKKIVFEMADVDADYLPYSWWMTGKIRATFDALKKEIGLEDKTFISSLELTREKWELLRKHGYPYYLISMCGIFKHEFLKGMWMKDQKRLPLGLKRFIFKGMAACTKIGILKTGHKPLFERINRRFFGNRIRKYPKETPFEIEKGPERVDMLPLRFALPKKELFACIDANINDPGYSLIERGLYHSVGNTSIHEKTEKILTEIGTVLSKIDQRQVDQLVKNILSARKIIGSGAGRVGMAVRGFVMRLKHLGLDAYILGDANVPSLKQEDLFLVCSGSGETQTIYELVMIARKNQATISLITGNPDSRMGKIADTIVELKAPSKTKAVAGFTSIQPMTTLNEQSLAIFLDAVVLRLMQELNESHETMWDRHSNLE